MKKFIFLMLLGTRSNLLASQDCPLFPEPLNYAVSDAVRDHVLKRLREIETDSNIKILLAIESGSRAWGFASQDSDYDVRFIYVHPTEWYVHLEPENLPNESRGAFHLPLQGEWDFSGWDLHKALQLLYRSNAPLLEWLRSPIVYTNDGRMDPELLTMSEQFYSPRASLYHYRNMAQDSYQDHLKDRKEVIRKSYLYVIRPLLACRWIEQKGTFPPMEIDKLLETVDGLAIRSSIERLIADKRASIEMGSAPVNRELQDFIEREFARFKQRSKAGHPEKNELVKLNGYFRERLNRENSRSL